MSTRCKKSLVSLLFFVFSITISLGATVPKESWMNVYLMGDKIGYYHEIKDETTYKNETVIRLVSDMVSKLKRFGLDFDVDQSVTIYLSKDLKPKYCRYHEVMMGSEKYITAWVENGKMIEETLIGSETTRKSRDWDAKTQFDASLNEVILRDGLVMGKKYKFDVYSPELGKSFQVAASVGSTQRISAGGVWYEAIPINADYTGMQELSTITYITKAGDIVKGEVGNYGMSMIRSTEAEAKTFDSKVDVADISRVKSNVEIVDPESVTQSKLKITVKEGNATDMIPSDSRQQWDGKVTGASGTLIITSPKGAMEFSPSWPVPITDKSLSLFTASSPYIETSDKDISATAHKVAGTEKNAWKAAVKLADWVYNAVENKGFDTGFASAKQTFTNRKGDCTEHSVLLAALTRSLGIPTKIVVGLAAVEDGFYYHMWTEVYVGQWVSLDPTFNEPRVDAMHIKLSETKSKEDELGDYAVQLLKTLKKLDIEVLEYTANNQVIKPDPTEKPSTMNEMDIIKQLLSE